jgi:hypothetical protein
VNRLIARLNGAGVSLKRCTVYGFVFLFTFITTQTFHSSLRISKLQTSPAMADDKPNCKVILANNIAKSVLEEVKDGLSKIERKPLLVGFLSSSDPAARVYAEWTGKTCTEK